MNLENTCYIVGAASLEGVRLSPCAGDYIIAADGGYRSLRARGIEPDFVMGDFDSLGYRRLVMAGALGGRIDQTIASFQTLRGLTDAGAQGWLIGCGWVVTAVQNGTLTFPAAMEGTVSVFSSGDAARGVTLRGLLYEVTDATLTCAMPLGVSNSFTGAEASVHVADGTVFVLWQGDALPDGLEVRHGAD